MSNQSKPYVLRFEERPAYLYASVKFDTIKRNTVLLYLRETIDKCRKLKSKCLLIDRNAPATLASTDTFLAATEIADLGITDMRIALVDRLAENKAALAFAALVVNNRGGNIKLFQTVPEAEKWLLGGSGVQPILLLPFGIVAWAEAVLLHGTLSSTPMI